MNTLNNRVPTDLQKALSSKPAVFETWKDITPIARRDFVTWIESAKQPETRARRIEVTLSKLASGKRRPCCYAVVPIHLYKALSANPKAKATWSILTPDEKRDFASWVESSANTSLREVRIQEVCSK